MQRADVLHNKIFFGLAKHQNQYLSLAIYSSSLNQTLVYIHEVGLYFGDALCDKHENFSWKTILSMRKIT